MGEGARAPPAPPPSYATGKSHQNDDYLKQAMRKIVFSQDSNLQTLDYRSKKNRRAERRVEQWTGNPQAEGSIPVGRQFFRIASFK